MTYHYHVVKCPYCGEQHQRGCSLDNCTTAIVSLEPFTSSDGYKAELMICLPRTRGGIFYVDFGDREAKQWA